MNLNENIIKAIGNICMKTKISDSLNDKFISNIKKAVSKLVVIVEKMDIE